MAVLDEYANVLHEYLTLFKPALDINDVHIVFELKPREEDVGNSQLECRYYLVQHKTRTVFWLDNFDASCLPMWSEVSGVKSPTHVRKFE